MLKSRMLSRLGLALALVLTLGAGQASADLAVTGFDLTALNISGGTGPYVHVTVDLVNSTTATFDFVALSDSSFNYAMLSKGAAAASINATTFTVTNTSATASPLGTSFTPADVTPDTSVGNEDGFGSFNAGVDIFDSTTHSVKEIKFTVNNTSGTWSTITGGLTPLLTPNNNNQILAAQVGEWVTGQTTFAATGYASGAKGTGTPNAAPEPSAMALAALGGMGFLGYFLRRRKK